MNFSIDLVKLGELPVIKIVIIGVFIVVGLLIWKLPDIIRAIKEK